MEVMSTGGPLERTFTNDQDLNSTTNSVRGKRAQRLFSQDDELFQNKSSTGAPESPTKSVVSKELDFQSKQTSFIIFHYRNYSKNY